MDALLTQHGKLLQVGQEMRLTLIKGTSCMLVPDSIQPQHAPPEPFPIVAKFGESVVRPDFRRFVRFYQQDIPSQKDDSDNEGDSSQQTLRKKRKFRRRNDGPRRQWVLQQEEDYLETMIEQKEKGQSYKQDSNRLSTRYEGLPEHNPSHYVLLHVASKQHLEPTIQATLLPTPYAVQSFSQPARVHTLSMTEAEQAIANQRMHMTRYMLHAKQATATSSGDTTIKASQEKLSLARPSTTKARLLGKLVSLSTQAAAKDGIDEDEDDIMADVKFSNRKGAASRARRELLSMADGVTLDADGVMGGANDAEFGGKRRFLNNAIAVSKTPSGRTNQETSTSNDGNAMADDFYQRDVKAEYEEMDYDPNDQFDDDDVDLGEAEVNIHAGFNDDLDDDDNDLEDDEEEDEDDGKKAGLATIKGLKDMLAKARGETTDGEKKETEDENGRPSSPAGSVEKSISDDATNLNQNSNNNNSTSSNNNNNQNSIKTSTVTPSSPAGTDSSNIADDGTSKNNTNSNLSSATKKPLTVQLDEFGQRVLTLEGVRYEIFLHNKSIAMKKLMKLYNIKKKTEPERIKQFQAIIKELCNIHKDPAQGNMLVLKQHYSKAQV